MKVTSRWLSHACELVCEYGCQGNRRKMHFPISIEQIKIRSMYRIVRYVIFQHNLYRDKKVHEYSHFCTKGWCT